MTLDQFPTLTAHLNDKQRAGFAAALAAYEAAVAAGGMPKVVYEEKIKYWINKAFEIAWGAAIGDRFTRRGLWESLDEADQKLNWSLNTPTCANYGAQLKRARARDPKVSAFAAACVRFLEEIEPLAKAVTELKDKIQKRQPKADPYEKYRAPIAALGAIGLVRARLEEIFESHRQALTQAIADDMAATLAKVEGLSAKLLEMPRGTTYKSEEERAIAAAEKTLNGLCAYIPSAAWTRDRVENGAAHIRGLRTLYRYRAEAGASAIIAAEAEKAATRWRDGFVYKNLVKFDSIVDKKGNLDRIEIVSSEVSLSGLEGTLRLHFKDGSRFDARNQTVWSVSVHGKEFERWPLTFTNVILPNGEKMPKPSEQRVNEIFAIA